MSRIDDYKGDKYDDIHQVYVKDDPLVLWEILEYYTNNMPKNPSKNLTNTIAEIKKELGYGNEE